MTLWLGSRAAVRTVTLVTVTDTTGIVSPRTAYEGCGRMTGMAIQSGRDVGVMLTRCRTTIMAGRTIIDDAGMIEPGPDEASGCMADAAVLVCWYMAACFTYGICAIMTGATVIHDANMIKGCWSKACGLVAVTAITGGWHMVRWRGFSSGGCTIMASRTAIHDACVIIFGTGKGRGVMT